MSSDSAKPEDRLAALALLQYVLPTGGSGVSVTDGIRSLATVLPLVLPWLHVEESEQATALLAKLSEVQADAYRLYSALARRARAGGTE